ncbi:hypothetical protein E2562_012369 [Oryza meyeriana var. granulata]|uniref:Uncharacterized protein n=1 Tax=Oryza meyeriana var. granulata TaxID=110450 RepID=A0A6G1C5M2_9ORYZ|nr:hypothetical protein E2562_012369 [Oryza meyeriana var. granulata]
MLALLKTRSEMDATFREASLKGPLWEEWVNMLRDRSEIMEPEELSSSGVEARIAGRQPAVAVSIWRLLSPSSIQRLPSMQVVVPNQHESIYSLSPHLGLDCVQSCVIWGQISASLLGRSKAGGGYLPQGEGRHTATYRTGSYTATITENAHMVLPIFLGLGMSCQIKSQG